MATTFSNFGDATYNAVTKEFSLTTATSNSVGIIYTELSPATNYMSSMWCWTPASSNINFNYHQFIGDINSNVGIRFNNSNISLEIGGCNVATSNIRNIVSYNTSNNIMTNVLNDTITLKFNTSNVFVFTSNDGLPDSYNAEPFIQIGSSNVPESSNFIHRVKSFGIQNNFALVNHTLFNSNVNILGTLYASNIRSPSMQSQSFSTMNVLEGVTLSNINNGGYAWLNTNNRDETAALSNFIYNSNNFSVESDAHKHIIVETKTGYLHLNNRISIPDNISLEFKCTVAAGQKFQLQLTGSAIEVPSALSSAPTVVGDVYEDETSITIDTTGKASISSWTVGTYIAIRSSALNSRQDNQIAGITNLGSNQFRLTLQTPISGFDIIGGGTVRAYVSTLLSSPASRGDTLLNTTSTLGYFEGAYIVIADRRNAGDFAGNPITQVGNPTRRLWYSNNKFKMEIRHVLKVNSVNNTLQLESPVSNDYDTTNAYIILLKPAYNSTIKGLKFFFVETPSYPRNNRHSITFDTVVNSSIEDIVYSDSFPHINSNVQFPNINHLINIRESYNCSVRNVTTSRKSTLFTDSGCSYGLTAYTCSFCYFDNLNIRGTFRHGILLQSADHTYWNNVVLSAGLISSFDMHGLNETDNVITNLHIDGSEGQVAVGQDNTTPVHSTSAFIRLGNETHPCGSSHNVFDGVTLKHGQPRSPITTVYGINLVPRCINNTFRNVVIDDVDVAIALYDHSRGRLNPLLISASNVFDNFIIKDCNRVIDINGADNIGSSLSRTNTTIASVPSTSNIILNTTTSLSTFQNAYVGWVLQHSSNNYNVNAYDASTKQITISGTFLGTPAVSNAVTLQDSLTRSINPIRDFTFTNSKILNNSNLCNFYSCTGVRTVNNYFNSNIGLRYTYDMLNASNVSILDNHIEYTKRFVQWSNVTNANIVGNQLTYITECNIINDLGGNSNMLWKHNHANGFRPTFSANSNTSFVADLTTLGYSNAPHQLGGICINNANGAVGIGTSNLVAGNALYFNNAFANRKIVLGSINATSDHQFYGLGYNSNILRYQVGANGGAHVFYLQSNTTSVEYMRINSNGIIVNGSISANNIGAGNNIVDGFTMNNNTSINFKNTSGTSKPILTVDNGDFTKLQCETLLSLNPDNNAATFINFNNTGAIACYTGNTQTMRITNCNVGIRTTSPSAPLHVVGTSILNGDVGIGTASPSHRLDVAGTGLRVLGGAGTTPTIIYLNSTGAANTTSQLQFVNSGHTITCTDSNNYQGIPNTDGGHKIYYNSGSHNFNNRVQVNGDLRTTGTMTVGGSAFKGIFCGTYTVSGSGNEGNYYHTITHNWGISSGTQIFNFAHVDTTTPVVGDAFAIKVISISANSFEIYVSRTDNSGGGSQWSRSFTLQYTIIVV
jgi:hypothetical protein